MWRRWHLEFLRSLDIKPQEIDRHISHIQTEIFEFFLAEISDYAWPHQPAIPTRDAVCHSSDDLPQRNVVCEAILEIKCFKLSDSFLRHLNPVVPSLFAHRWWSLLLDSTAHGASNAYPSGEQKDETIHHTHGLKRTNKGDAR